MATAFDRYRVRPGTDLDLRATDPTDDVAFAGDKDAGYDRLDELTGRLGKLQEEFHADGSHRVLIVLQAMDTAGKDSTIRAVFRGTNPLGITAHSFAAPTARELSRDFLWRVHRFVPGDGEIVVFNRSHYEDVLVARVKGLVPEARWRRRYRHIRDFEQMLVEEGTVIRKFFLHISPEHQAERLRRRIEHPSKRWKLDPSDLADRRRWYDYLAAYQDAISETSTDAAPWYVIPSDRRWYRKLAVAEVVVDTVAGLDLRRPAPPPDVEQLVVPEPAAPAGRA